jgi:hypothetical protein
MASTTPGQFVVYAPGGIHLLGGTIHGNGSTLTGINASNLIGLGSAALKPYNYFALASAASTAIGASNLAKTANGTANSAYNTAASALQSDGRVDWSGTQNAAGQSLTNLQGAYAYAVTQQTFEVVQSHLTSLYVTEVGENGFPYNGTYYGSMTDGFHGPASIAHDGAWNWSFLWYTANSGSEYFGSFDPSMGSGGFSAGGHYVTYEILYYEGRFS